MGREAREEARSIKPAITRVSNYDNWSAFLTAGVIVLAALVAVLFGIWLTTSDQVTWAPDGGILIPGPELVSDQQSNLDFVIPGFSELPEARSPEMQETMVALTTVASNVAASDVLLDGEQSDGLGTFGGGEGDTRIPGAVIAPDWERWQIEYNPESRQDYFAMLQQFGVYLGAVSQTSNQIRFLNGLTAAKPVVIDGTRSSELAENIYFRNVRSRLRVWDKLKLREASIDLDGTIVVQFYPVETCNILRELEAQQLLQDERTLDQVRKIRFGCKKAGDGFEYFVEQVVYQSEL